MNGTHSEWSLNGPWNVPAIQSTEGWLKGDWKVTECQGMVVFRLAGHPGVKLRYLFTVVLGEKGIMHYANTEKALHHVLHKDLKLILGKLKVKM